VNQTPATAPPVLITDCDHSDTDAEAAVLEAAGLGWRLGQYASAAELIRGGAGARVLINQYTPITAAVLDALPDVQLVVRYGVGVDSVDVAAATERGVWVANVPDYGTAEVADHTIALTMALLRGISVLSRATAAGEWDYQKAVPLRRLSELTFGVIGCGAIGRAVAARAAALGMRVMGTDVDQSRGAEAPDQLTLVALDELLAEADVISLHATLNETSRHLIGADTLARMKPGGYVINTARGGLIDTAALLAALDEGRLAGAGLDVLETEPPGELGGRLAAHPAAVVTPHAAWYSEESFRALKTSVAEEAVRVLTGAAPRCPVNRPERLRGVA